MSLSYSDTKSGLANKTNYVVSVTVSNINGRSKTSAQIPARPLAAPAAVSSLTATAGIAQINFTAGCAETPVTDISGFEFEITPAVGGSTKMVAARSGGQSPFSGTLSGLTNDTTYSVRAKTININNDVAATWSSLVSGLQPLAAPAAPTLAAVYEDDSEARFTVTTTAAELALTTLTTTITNSPSGGTYTRSSVTDGAGNRVETVTVTGLVNRTAYTFTVTNTNKNGTVGTASTITMTPYVPVPVTYRSIAAGASHVLAVKSDGTVWGWGNNGDAQLGINNQTTPQSTAVQVSNISNVVSVTCALQSSFAILSTGEVMAWGNGSNNVLGLNSVALQTTPTYVKTGTSPNLVNLSNIVHIAASDRHTVFLNKKGDVYITGTPSSGFDIGLGTNVSSAVAKLVTDSNVSNIVKVACGSDYTILLKADGTLLGCGRNANGQLGTGVNPVQSPFTAIVTSVSNVIDIVSGGQSNGTLVGTFALTSAGNVWGWGVNQNNFINETASGGTISIPTLVKESAGVTLSNVVGIARSFASGTSATAVYLMADGTVRSVGSNSGGQYGIGNSNPSTTPGYAASAQTMRGTNTGTLLTTVMQVTCGATGFTHCLLADGSVCGVGSQTNGVLGNGVITGNLTYATAAPISGIRLQRPAFGTSRFQAAVGTPYNVADLVKHVNTNFPYYPGTGQARGLAITGFTGSWSYSTTGSVGTYTSIPLASATYATLLQGHPSVWIQCSTTGGTITVKAWDERYAGTSPAYGLAIVGVDTTVTEAANPFAFYSFSG